MNTDIDGLIHRIVSGYYYININNIEYLIKSPNLNTRSRARFVYRSIIEDNKFDIVNWIPDHQINALLVVNNIWNNTKDKELEEQHKLLEQTKVDLFLNYSNDKTRKTLKNNIINISKHINQLYAYKNYFNFLSLDFYAKTVENQFLVLNMVYIDDSLAFSYNDNDIDSDLLMRITEQIQTYSIDMDMMKNIVKSYQWKQYWNASKDNIFSGPSYEWTEEQITLVNLSKTYDAIREHMESPTEEIIEDNDALDGWMIYQNRKIEKEKKKQKVEDKYGLNNKRADEIFILTDSVEETKEIFDLNDPQAKAKINQLKQIVKDNKETKWQDIPFVKQELQQMSTRKG